MADYKNVWWNEDDDLKWRKGKKVEKEVTAEKLASDMYDIKLQIEELENKYKLKNKELLGMLKNTETKSLSFYRNGKIFIAKLVESTRTVVNEEKLKSLIPASVWETILSNKVDQSKLTKAITSGEIDVDSVADAVAILPSSPYWRFSTKSEEKE